MTRSSGTGWSAIAAPLDAEYDEGAIAFAFAVEHLGTREILPGAGDRLRFTGKGEPFLFAAGDSDALRQTAERPRSGGGWTGPRSCRGSGCPTAGQVPPICSMGGLGTFFQRRLIPTLAMISGPWSLYAPSFRRSAIDFGRMRSQLLAVGDSVLALDGPPARPDRRRLPGDRRQLAQGAPTCPPEVYPQFAPGPGR